MAADLDLRISGSSCDILCRCSRWDVANYKFVVETWLTKSQLTDLEASMTPGAVGELYRILGKPMYYDGTWSKANTLTFSPTGNSNLQYMARETTGYVKNVTTRVLDGDAGWISVKIECNMSGSGAL